MKNSLPLVSVVITYFKKKKFIRKTLNSISNQTYKNYELVFVYDDNDKKDLNFIKEAISKFKRKKLIINKRNFGVSKSRNIGIRSSKGSYIAFIDSDDIWKKNKLLEQLNFMKNKSYVFTFTSFDIVNENNKTISHRNVINDATYSELYKSNFIGLSTVIVNKKVFPKLKFPNLKTQEDFALWLYLLRNGFKLRHFNKNLSCWKRTSNSLSSNSFQKLKDAFKLYYYLENKNFIFAIYSVMILTYNKLIKQLSN